jgi:hypothetical protein
VSHASEFRAHQDVVVGDQRVKLEEELLLFGNEQLFDTVDSRML